MNTDHGLKTNVFNIPRLRISEIANPQDKSPKNKWNTDWKPKVNVSKQYVESNNDSKLSRSKGSPRENLNWIRDYLIFYIVNVIVNSALVSVYVIYVFSESTTC